MKSYISNFHYVKAVLATVMLGGMFLSNARCEEGVASSVEKPAVSDAKMKQPTNEIPRSVFTIPSETTEGRDPFFPNLVDSEASTKAGKSGKTGGKPATAEFVLQGISGSGDRRLAVIGGHSFAAGEESDVLVPTGRVRIRCLEIKDDSVIIEIGGERREIRFKGAK